MSKLLEELKRRKVVRVAGVYAVVAWLLIQVANNLVPALQLPAWTNSFIVLLLLIGFPIALVLAWAYEITPEGERQERTAHDAVGTASHANEGVNNKLLYAMFALLLVAVAFQIVDRFTGGNPAPPPPVRNEIRGEMQLLRVSLSLGELERRTAGARSSLALSADGRWLAYTVQLNETSNLLLRDLVTGETRTLVESDATGGYPINPSFSPSGEQILYNVNGSGETHVVASAGGRPRNLVVNTGPYLVNNYSASAPAWLSEQSIVFTNSDGFLERLNIPTGEITLLNIPRIEGEANTWPRLMGDGPWLLYTVLTAEGFGSARMDAFNMSSGEVRTLLANGYNGHYLNTGHVVYMRDNALWAVSIDSQQMQINGRETLIEDRIEANLLTGLASYTVSQQGRLIYLAGGNIEDLLNTEQWVLSSVTGERQTINLPANAYHPVFSPDGTQVAVTVQESAGASSSNILGYIALYHIADGSLSRRSFIGAAFRPKWTPDGTQLVYGMFMDDAWGLWMRTADGSGQPRQLLSATEPVWPESITQDGSSLVYGISDQASASRLRLRLLSLLESEATGQPLIDFGDRQIGAAISPDGRFIAYSGNEISNESHDIIVRPFPNVNDGQWQITSGSYAVQAVWESSGKSMYIMNTNADIYRVPADPENSFRQGTPELVFDSIFRGNFYRVPGFAVSPDGQRFLYRELSAASTSFAAETTYAELVENWTEKLRQMAPAAN